MQTESQTTTIPGMLNMSIPGLIQDPQGQQLVSAAQKDPAIEESVSRAMRVVEARLMDAGVRDQIAAEIGSIGRDPRLASNRQSDMLGQRIRDLARRSEAGGEISKVLIGLSEETRNLNPNQIRDSFPGLAETLVGWLPFFGPTLKVYMRKFETAQELLNQIVQDLSEGADTLERDNTTLKGDRDVVRQRSRALASYAAQGIALYQRLGDRAATLPEGDEQRTFIIQELMHPLGQAVLDLMTRIQVALQRVLSIDMIVGNNDELIRAVRRSQSTTMEALEAGVAIAVALSNQEQVLKGVTAANEATVTIIEGNARRLKTQGAAIHKLASGAMLDVTRLSKAFGDLSAALTDVETYRTRAVATMQGQMTQLDGLNRQAEQVVGRMEKGGRVRQEVNLLGLDAIGSGGGVQVTM